MPSVIGGWYTNAIPHTHSAPGQYDATVTGMIVRYNGEPRALLPLHRKYGVRLPPGGHIKLNENPWQATAQCSKRTTEMLSFGFGSMTIRPASASSMNP